MGTESARWDAEALRELVAGGATVRVEGSPERVAALGELAGTPLEPADGPLRTVLPSVHTADTFAVVSAWRQAMDAPGTLVETSCRVHLDGVWVRRRIRFLNLLDHEAGVFVSLADGDEALDPAAIEPQDDLGTTSGLHTAWVVLRFDGRARVIEAEGDTAAVLGRSREEVVGMAALDLVHPEDREASLSIGIIAATAPGVARHLDHRVVHPDGTVVWVDATVTAPEGPGAALVLTLVDITARRAQEAALEASRQQNESLAQEFRLLAEEVPAAVFRATLDGRIVFANRRFEELAGHAVANLLEIARPQDRPAIERALYELADRTSAGSRDDRSVVEVRPPAGDRHLALRLGIAGAHADEVGSVVGVVLDVSPTAELRRRVHTDGLTGLSNRTALDTELAELLAEGRELAVLFVDCDGFKAVNDDHGHHVGDDVLRAIGRRLANLVREGEQVARYGGDEFVIVCTDASAEAVRSVENRIHASLADPVHFGDSLWQPSVSIGVGRSVPGDTAGTLLQRADQAMYEAKRARREGGSPTADGGRR